MNHFSAPGCTGLDEVWLHHLECLLANIISSSLLISVVKVLPFKFSYCFCFCRISNIIFVVVNKNTF